jgi:hypothetical protein
MLRFTETFILQWSSLDEAHRARPTRRLGLLARLAVDLLATTDRVGDAPSARLGR